MTPVKLVILDRDGTINEDRNDFVKSADEWIPIPGALEAIARLNHAGWHVVIATNQSGIGRGIFDMSTLNAMHLKMNRLLAKLSGRVDAVFFCPHVADDKCQCRKPLPGMFRQISERFGVDLNKVLVAGDSLRDLQAGAALGCEPHLVCTGKAAAMSDLQLAQTVATVPGTFMHADLTAFAAKHELEEVLIALHSAPGSCITSVLRSCHDAGLRCRTIPSLAEVIENRALAPQIRDVAVEDLLGRSPVLLDQHAIRETLGGQVVMVTGAAGSIGSELCRQIARFGPLSIIGYDIAETPLFEIDRELGKTFPELDFQPVIGSIQNRSRLDEVLRRHHPSVIYHAAAYKHVPLMESHLFEAVENNILGTLNVALAAAEHDVRDFVMISSDKAVRPTNVMGATKRVAELMVNALQNGSTKYASVRFGNVLGSNGSVVPIFKKQIASGGPITITHPEMKRYFMTIPEAAQLVLQASTMSKGGEIFVLDMGKQVRIVDLAINLILLSGLRPQEDIGLQFTGIRPGEKLYEELCCSDESTLPTFHEKILIYTGPDLAADEMQRRLNSIRRYCAERDARKLFLELKKVVPDYNPSGDILGRLLASDPELEQNAAALMMAQRVTA